MGPTLPGELPPFFLVVINGSNLKSRAAPNIVPGSDCAGEVVAVGSLAHDFAPGDRVCANFNPEHVQGEMETARQRAAGLGALVDGVLTEYRTFPAYVSLKCPGSGRFDSGSCRNADRSYCSA